MTARESGHSSGLDAVSQYRDERIERLLYAIPNWQELEGDADSLERDLTELRGHLARHHPHEANDTTREDLQDALAEADADRLVKQARIEELERVVEAASHGDRTDYEADGIDPETGDSVPMMVPLVVFQGSDAVNLMRALDTLKEQG